MCKKTCLSVYPSTHLDLIGYLEIVTLPLIANVKHVFYTGRCALLLFEKHEYHIITVRVNPRVYEVGSTLL